MTGAPSRTVVLAEINVTPLIDVMLVLLIVFMLVVPLSQQGLDVALPRPPDGITPPPTGALMLTVSDSGLLLNTAPVGSLEELGTKLRDLIGARPDRTLFVQVSGSVRYGSVVAALDVGRGAGVERVGIIR